LQTVFVRIGERVVAGQALAQMDTSGLSLAVNQARADARAAAANTAQSTVDRTTAKITTDEAQLRREESLYAAGVAPLKDVQAAREQLALDRADAASARAQISGAGAQQQSAQARAALAERDLQNATLRAPSDGVVTAILKRAGEAVDTSTPVIGLGPSATREVTLSVSPADAARVHTGDRVALSLPGTDLRGIGRVAGVSSAVDPSTQTATVVVDGVPPGAPSGSAVQAVIDVARVHGLIVPQSAIVQDPQTGETLVFAQTRDKNGDPKFEQKTVAVAHQNGTLAVIASGLHAGERIASQGAFALLAPADGGD
jgi:RND family efflux transporter MFP subunit